MRERALHFGETAKLMGVVSEPDPDEGLDGGAETAVDVDERRRRAEAKPPAVILLNAGILHRVGPSRMNVRIAWALARRGFTCLRFDFSGLGDSEPRSDRLSFEESSVREIREAMDHLQESRGCSRFVLVGLCSGADAALQGALADTRVAGLIPIDGHAYRNWRYYVRRFLPRLFRLRSWLNVLRGRSYVVPWIRAKFGEERGAGISVGRAGRGDGRDGGGGRVFQRPERPKEEVEDALRVLVARKVKMLHLFSGGMDEVYNYASQFRDTFRDVDFEGHAEVDFFPGANHTFTDLEQLDALVTSVEDWCVRTWRSPLPSAAEKRGDRAA